MKRIPLMSAVLLLLACCIPASATTWKYVNLSATPATASSCRAVSSTQQAGASTVGANSHATLWNGSPSGSIDLHPDGVNNSAINAICGNQQGGYTFADTMANSRRAAMWSGTAASYVNLHPTNAYSSDVIGMYGSQQGGYVYTTSSTYHASLWNGSADNWVDLNPTTPGYWMSTIYGMTDGQQVGYAQSGGSFRACLWSGTAASYVNLGPAANPSVAWGASDGQQVGQVGVGDTGSYAALWTGTAASIVNLNPTNAVISGAYAVSHGKQAGYATIGAYDHAGIWSGTAASWVDLGALLPSNTYSNSYARGIEVIGSNVWVSGYAYNKVTQTYNAMLWQYAVPEPSALLALSSAILGFAGLALRRGRA